MSKRGHIGGGWRTERKRMIRRRDPSRNSGKTQLADAVSAASYPLRSQPCLASQLVDTAEATFLTSHNRTTFFVRPRNLPVHLASLAERFPLFMSDLNEKGLLHKSKTWIKVMDKPRTNLDKQHIAYATPRYPKDST